MQAFRRNNRLTNNNPRNVRRRFIPINRLRFGQNFRANVVNRPRNRFIRNPNNNLRRRRGNNNNNRGINNNMTNNAFRKKINKSIQDITKLIKRTSLSGGPLKNINMSNKKNINDPNSIKKEIRYDKLYNAFEMYNMGKYYSFFKTTNMILRIAIYSTYNISFNANTNCSFLWLPYAYPYIDNRFTVTNTSSIDVEADAYSDFYWAEEQGGMNNPASTLSSIPGNFRLIAASLKISNITTNSLKGGSYTVYRISKNEGQPIYYNTNTQITYNTSFFQQIRKIMEEENYENEPIKYLYNANQVCQCNEFGVIQGNDIFQDCAEYMGSKQPNSLASSVDVGWVGGRQQDFNPTGVNIKYVGRFDGTTTQQSYKFQSVKIFEVTPYSSNSLSAAAFKGSKSVSSNVISQAKNKFNLDCFDS